jgi:hypothetical protein
MTKEQFQKITGVVIDKLEGGYFHPDMYANNTAKFSSYGSSGETMFGLDRHAGHDIYYSTPRKTDSVRDNIKYIENGSYSYRTPEAKEFWTAVDKAGARKNWSWNYKGGNDYNRLKTLASDIIFERFLKYSKLYLTPEALKVVENDPRLTFNFSYAVWNGPAWFKKFADVINRAVASGITDSDKLVDIALKSRTDSSVKLIRTGGEKIAKFIDEVKQFDTSEDNKPKTGTSNTTKIVISSLLVALGVAAIYTLYKTLKNKKQ